MSTVREEINFYVALIKAAGNEPPRRGRMSDKLYVAVLRNRIAATRIDIMSMSAVQRSGLKTANGRKHLAARAVQAYMTKAGGEVFYETH